MLLPEKRRPVIRTGFGFIRPYRRQIVYASLALIFTAAVTLSLGQGIRLLIDEGFATRSSENLASSIQLFLALVFAMAIGTFTRYYWVSWIGERVVTDIRKRVFSHLIYLHPGFFEDNRSLEIQSRLTADTTLLQSVIGSSVSIALRNLLMMIGGVIWLFLTNAKLTAIVMISVPLVVTPILYFGRKVRALSRTNQDRIADVGSYVGEILGEIKTVQAYNHQNTDIRHFNGVAEQAFDVAIQRVRQRSWLITLVILLVLGAIAAMLWVGGSDVIQGEITGGELAAFLFYSIIVGSAVGSISEVISELQRAAGALERITELLLSRSEILSPETTLQTPTFETQATKSPILELMGVRFHYPSRPEQWAIDGLNLAIQPGETLALVGPSGAGKSTLFDLLLRFYDVHSGSIEIKQCNIKAIDLNTLRNQFALVSQQPALFFGTIEDNIRYGRPDASLDDVIQAAKAAHAHEFINALPKAYRTRLGDAGLGLSGGQKQRLAIARAVLADAPILLLDEATSALDAESEYLVQGALEKLMQNRTTLVIAHRLATVKTADRIAVMNAGRIEAIGSHDALLESSPLYRRLASLQFNDAVLQSSKETIVSAQDSAS
ncbi:MAG: ABC transporter ATP-binding protein [Oleiphilus sp.]|nr:MAG: ABC transporter ATP-binding protein [Oleiphilus sp.]